MLDKTVETALDALYKFGLDLEVEIAARFSAKEVNDDIRQTYRFVEIEEVSATYIESTQKVLFNVVATFEYDNANNKVSEKVGIKDQFDSLNVQKCAEVLIESSDTYLVGLEQTSNAPDEFDDFKIQRDKKEELYD
jgi:hypothetical protein